MFSTEASDNDPTVLTDSEYTEIMISDILNTPFHKFLNDELNKKYSKNLLLSFINYIKNHENEVIRAFNDCFQAHEDFYKVVNNKNRNIESYKRPRGFPLELDNNWGYLYSMDNDVKYKALLDMKEENERATLSLKKPSKARKASLGNDDFFNSCDDMEGLDDVPSLDHLKQSKKKPSLKPIADGRLIFTEKYALFLNFEVKTWYPCLSGLA